MEICPLPPRLFLTLCPPLPNSLQFFQELIIHLILNKKQIINTLIDNEEMSSASVKMEEM